MEHGAAIVRLHSTTCHGIDVRQTDSSLVQAGRRSQRHSGTGSSGEDGLVARILARQYMKEFESECAPFQYAFSQREQAPIVWGTCSLRAATDNPQSPSLQRS